MDREQAREELLEREPDFLEPARERVNGHTSWVCPSCGNGSGRSGDGIAYDIHNKSHPHYKCFVCGLYEDVVGLWKLHTGETDDSRAFASLYKYYGIQADSKPTAREDFQSTKSEPKMDDTQKNIHTDTYTQAEAPNSMDYYRECQKHIAETDYPQKRGLSSGVVVKYMLGYDTHFNKGTGGRDWKALIIPTG